jgi:hypothetical protein
MGIDMERITEKHRMAVDATVAGDGQKDWQGQTLPTVLLRDLVIATTGQALRNQSLYAVPWSRTLRVGDRVEFVATLAPNELLSSPAEASLLDESAPVQPSLFALANGLPYKSLRPSIIVAMWGGCGGNSASIAFLGMATNS